MPSLPRVSWLSVLVCGSFAMGACKGDTGEQGTPGEPGEPGPPGETPRPEIELEPNGLVGRVMEPNMLPVPNGTVYLVPASDVEELSQTEINLFLSPEDTAMLEVDEPIEDLLDTKGASYESAAVEEGVYRFEELPPGSHFVVWVPAAEDNEHLPGGDSSRVSFATEELIGMRMDIRVSSQPSPAATYVGSSTCMGCHGLHSTTRTAHNVGLQVPGVRSILQDIELWPDFDEGLAFFGDPGTTLYYYDCNPMTLEPSKCKVEVNDPSPAGVVSFEVNLRRDPDAPLGVVGAYKVELVNRINVEPTQEYEVALTYGGALGKQQYLARRANTDQSGRFRSFTYFVLPMQYNYEGDFANDSSDDWPWRDYRSDLWYDFNDDELIRPDDFDDSESFDNNCAGCHFTGYRLEGSEADGWSARAVVDPGGAFDYDGDDRVELINVGCESCHGPGSDHLMPSPNGRHIVSPGLLTSGRQAMLCGSCHSRPLGIGSGMTEPTGLPLSTENQMPPPGIRRRDFAVNHTTRVSGAEDAFFDSGDALGNYQQYSEHLLTEHYRNPVRLMTCTNCHSPHANDADIAAMDTSGNPNALCTTCHSPDNNPELYPLTDHVVFVTPGADIGDGTNQHDSLGPFLCTQCHMVPTAKSGASIPALLDASPSSQPAVQYYWNDIASHRMTMTRWVEGEQPDQPISFTNECGGCHVAFLPNLPTP